MIGQPDLIEKTDRGRRSAAGIYGAVVTAAVGEQLRTGLLIVTVVRAGLASTWPMVGASYAPLLALILARFVGASALTAANIGLAAALVLLVYRGWPAGRAANLQGKTLLVATSVAAALGMVMIVTEPGSAITLSPPIGASLPGVVVSVAVIGSPANSGVHGETAATSAV